MQEQHERYMRIALEDAATGKSEGNVAVGSIIVKDGEVIARGRNLVATDKDPTAHAETVALRVAGKSTGDV
ncbi:MAG: nucleoside deaminase, partial [Chloroflexi bacterium]|nr:nucleoside deaminase [Chloroflexota bacterium]